MLNRKSEDRRRKRRQSSRIYTGRARKAKFNSLKFSGDDNNEETPVPIPNTEVKLIDAENTCGLPCWEDRKLPDFIFKKVKISNNYIYY